MKHVVVISPHLDDAMLSCTLHIIRHVDQGDRVLVATVFSSGANYENRKKEDKLACAALEAEFVHLGFLDAPYRREHYINIKELVFADLDEKDQEYVHAISKTLSKIIRQCQADLIYCPLAVGRHIDHRIVFNAVHNMERSPTILYYEDRPYVLWPGNLTARLGNLGVKHDIAPVVWEKMASSLEDYFFLQYFVPIGAVRDECLALYRKDLENTTNASAPVLIPSQSTSYFADIRELDKIWTVLQFYESQIEHIYGIRENFIEDNRKYCREHFAQDGYFERVWSMALVSREDL